MNPLKESIRFYARHIEALLLLSGVILLPFLLVHNVTINYVSFLAALAGAPVVSSFYNLFLMLVFLTVVQIVFVQYVKSQLEGEERPLRHAFRTFFENGFSVFLFGIVYALAVCLGMVLFVVPGVVLLILFCLTPFLVVLKKRSPWKCMRSAFELAKRHFVPLLGLILLASTVQWLISMAGFASVIYITTSFGAVWFTQLLLNVIVFPLITVIFTMYTHQWISEPSEEKGLEPVEG